MSCTQLLLPTSGCLSIWPPEGLLHHLKACAETTLTQTKKLVPGHFQQHQQQQAHTVLSFTSLQPEEKALRWDRTLLLGQTLMNSGRGRNHTDREAERSRQVWSTCGLLLNKNMIIRSASYTDLLFDFTATEILDDHRDFIQPFNPYGCWRSPLEFYVQIPSLEDMNDTVCSCVLWKKKGEKILY